MDEVDAGLYAACERQVAAVGKTTRYVRLHSDPMPQREVLPWLIGANYVKVVPSDDPDGDGKRRVGWGTTYFAVPWRKSVPR